jgi:hypothetical protein
MYRTGIRVTVPGLTDRLRPSGRNDAPVKIRRYRVEPREVERDPELCTVVSEVA